jgi:hypothetical protein
MLGFLAAPAGLFLTARADQGLSAGQGTQEGSTSTGAEDSLVARYSENFSRSYVAQFYVWREQPSDLIEGKLLVAAGGRKSRFLVNRSLCMLAQACGTISVPARSGVDLEALLVAYVAHLFTIVSMVYRSRG